SLSTTAEWAGHHRGRREGAPPARIHDRRRQRARRVLPLVLRGGTRQLRARSRAPGSRAAERRRADLPGPQAAGHLRGDAGVLPHPRRGRGGTRRERGARAGAVRADRAAADNGPARLPLDRDHAHRHAAWLRRVPELVPETSADAVIVGSALAGLVAAAILSRRGKRVVVLEHADTVGGRGGSVRTSDGYWIDFGHRDGHDVGDCQFPWQHGVEAAREAGATLALRRVERPLRVHRIPDDTVIDAGDWSGERFLAMARDLFECPPDGIAELGATLERLHRASPAEVEAAIPETLGTWSAVHVAHAGVRRALLLLATVIFHPRPEEASVGRLMEFLQRARTGPFLADDDEVGGMQGVVEPFARAVRAHGGEIALGWKPVDILVENGAVRGAVAVDRANFVREVRAPVVVSTYPLWENLELVDARLLPPELVASARALVAHRADL